MAPRPRVFTIAASAPFLPTLIEAIRSGTLTGAPPDDPLAASRTTLFLPTRRACRLARDAFLDTPHNGRPVAAALPRIAAIGDIDEDEFIFADVATGGVTAEALRLPPPIPALDRRVLLSKLVQAWAQSPRLQRPEAALVTATPTTALALADDLSRLIDDLLTRQVPWEALDTLVPDALDPYWAMTLDFLKIAREQWPAVLEELGVMEPAARRDRLIDAEAARLRAGLAGPVIAAGSTGSIPATATLLATIAALPGGAVVLPGLDTTLDDEAFDLIGHDAAEDAQGMPAAGHPQFAMHGLLRRLGLRRDEVIPLTPATARDGLASEVFRPAAVTHRWPEILARPAVRAQLREAMAGITIVAAATAEEEAFAIALALRKSLADPTRSVALVTPDRALARRVSAALAQWNVAVDDTAGDPLAATPAGVIARLAAEAALGGVAPVPLLALLKHPLCVLAARGAGIAALELAVLRGPRPRRGSAALHQALTHFVRGRDGLHRSDPRRALPTRALTEALAVVTELAEGLAPLEALGAEKRSLADLAERHRQVLDRLARLSSTPDADDLNDMLEEIATPRRQDVMLRPADYPELLALLASERTVRRPPTGAPVRIFGLLEARLQAIDHVVLGGLVEGVWPPQPRVDPWLSRPMRHSLGLDLPERRIGLSAHDFVQMLGAADVTVTYADKREGAPTVASRFVQRLAAVAGPELFGAARARGEAILALARTLDHPTRAAPAAQPAPSPPLALRPTRLSVSDVEDLLRDPYTIYAKHILRLAPLEAIDTPPGAADRGSLIHGVIEAFARQHASALPADPYGILLDLGREAFAPLDDFPEARAFWWPRFLRIARWFASWERERRDAIAELVTEERGAIDIAAGSRVITLSARADRLERLRDGRVAIIDYKTGQPPSAKQVLAGFAPQLTLEGAIVRAGGFSAFAAGTSIAEMSHVHLRGTDPAGIHKTVDVKNSSADAEADKALRRLKELLARFETAPYRSLVLPVWRTRYGDYDHLARVKEWSASGGAVESEP